MVPSYLCHCLDGDLQSVETSAASINRGPVNQSPLKFRAVRSRHQRCHSTQKKAIIAGDQHSESHRHLSANIEDDLDLGPNPKNDSSKSKSRVKESGAEWEIAGLYTLTSDHGLSKDRFNCEGQCTAQ
jgi:hypothetical protein